MKEKVKFYGSILILVIFVPYLVTVYLHGSMHGLFPGTGQDEQLEQQIVSLLAEQIPADYEMECLKAQAVIARTTLYGEVREKEDAPEDSGWTSARMQAAWGEDYERNLEKLETAVYETAGEILEYEGEPIQAAYHRVSNGKTRNGEEVPGQEEYTYLQSVDSQKDIQMDGFLSIDFMGKEDFAGALQPLFPEETIDASQLPAALEVVERDSADYVTQIQYGATIVNGEAVRTALGLNSACFYLSELEGKIRIVTKGVGHGLGLSQYGAERMAQKGWDYEEILQYYFQEVEIVRLK